MLTGYLEVDGKLTTALFDHDRGARTSWQFGRQEIVEVVERSRTCLTGQAPLDLGIADHDRSRPSGGDRGDPQPARDEADQLAHDRLVEPVIMDEFGPVRR